jgi:peptidoglycan/LPS O-acetylase OafA/YrhL
LLPDEFRHLGKHIASGAGFVSNFALWQESGYFDTAADSKPLLHLWSLGIEEQFYFLWPPLLVWAWKRKANLLNVVLGIVITSFCLNVLLVTLPAANAYYLPPARFWELLLGAMLAYLLQFRRESIDTLYARIGKNCPGFIAVHDVLATAGIVLLLMGLVFLDRERAYPGWWALFPTSSALLLISAGENAWINRRLLSARPLVFVGIISYPLYLWHWPLLSYLNIVRPDSASVATRVAAVLLSFILAWLTYRIVEKPVRATSNYSALLVTPLLILVGVLGLGVFSRSIHARSEGYGLEKILNASDEWGYPGQGLKIVLSSSGNYWERAGVSPKVLFVGDSNMEQYYPRIDKLAREHPDTMRGIVFVTRHGCPPIPYARGQGKVECAGFMERAFSLARNPEIDTVVIASAWSGHPDFNDPETREEGFRALESVIKGYRKIGRRVYLILSIPKGAEFDPHHLVLRGVPGFAFRIARRNVEQTKVVQELQPVTSRLLEIAKSTGAITIDPLDFICRDGVCPTLMADGSPTYRDQSHLRAAFVRQYATFMDDIVFLRDRS